MPYTVKQVFVSSLNLTDKFSITEQPEPTYQLVGKGSRTLKIKRLNTGVIDTVLINNISPTDWVLLHEYTYPIHF